MILNLRHALDAFTKKLQSPDIIKRALLWPMVLMFNFIKNNVNRK